MSLFLQQLVLGLMQGGLYVAVAIGFSLVWGHPQHRQLRPWVDGHRGAYATYFLFTHLGLDPFLASRWWPCSSSRSATGCSGA